MRRQISRPFTVPCNLWDGFARLRPWKTRRISCHGPQAAPPHGAAGYGPGLRRIVRHGQGRGAISGAQGALRHAITPASRPRNCQRADDFGQSGPQGARPRRPSPTGSSRGRGHSRGGPVATGVSLCLIPHRPDPAGPEPASKPGSSPAVRGDRYEFGRGTREPSGSEPVNLDLFPETGRCGRAVHILCRAGNKCPN